ncbi:hypothetical protein ACGYLI_17020 [Sulfitobacter sp. 1A13421]|uniref:hypothetical protein n=1 Tax=Sulfitobacter sp. 1A13421 TaxID=3368595 RepID=UPI0037455908
MTKVLEPSDALLEFCDGDADYDSLEECLDEFWKTFRTSPAIPPAVIIKAQTGLGKTTTTIGSVSKAIRNGEIGGTVLHIVTDHKNMKEAQILYQKNGVFPTLLKGMTASGCKFKTQVEERYKFGLSARTLCKSVDENGEVKKCPFYDDCGYIRTRQSIAKNPDLNVIICSAEYLRCGGIPEEVNPALIIVDESFSDKLVFEGYVKASEFGLVWANDQKSRASNRLRQMVNEILVLSMDRKPVVKELIEKHGLQGLKRELGSIINFRSKEKRAIAQGSAKQNSIVTQGAMRNEMMVWESMLTEVNEEIAQEAGSNKLKSTGAFHIIRSETGDRLDISRRTRFPYPDTPVLGLDATADAEIYGGVMNDTHELKVVSIKAKVNNMFTTAIFGQSWASSSLSVKSDKPYEAKGRLRIPSEEGKGRQKKLSPCLGAILKKEGDRKILICCTKSNKKVLLEELSIKDDLAAPNIQIENFGALKGRNDFKDFDTTIILGKLELPDSVVVRMARAFMDHDEAVKLIGDKAGRERKVRQYSTYSNHVALGHTHEYKDDMMKRIQYQMRELENVQCLGRVRAVNRPQADIRAYLLTDAIPESLVLDNAYHIDDFTKTSPLEELATEYENIVSVAAYSQHRGVRNNAATEFFKAHGFTANICPEGWALVKSRVSGQRGAATKLYIPTPALKMMEDDGTLEATIQKHLFHLGKLDSERTPITVTT